VAAGRRPRGKLQYARRDSNSGPRGIRKLRRGNFAFAEETTKSIVSRCPSTTSVSRFGFACVASFTAQRAEHSPDLRNPQISLGCLRPGQSTGQQASPPPHQRSRHGVEGLRDRRQGAHRARVDQSGKLGRCRKSSNKMAIRFSSTATTILRFTSMFAGVEVRQCSLSSRTWNCVNQSA